MVGRRSFGVMALIASMYVLLTAGGISMVYPFLLMLSTATTTQSDMQEYEVIPRYYYDDNALYRKYLWLRYDTGLGGATARDYNRAYVVGDPNRPSARLGGPALVSSFRLDEYFGWGDEDSPSDRGLAMPPRLDPADPDVRTRAGDLDRFLKESAVLWPGPALTETVAGSEQADGGDAPVRYVSDPYGHPLDPFGLTTGLGNRYRTVGYIGTVFVGFSGPGRDEWTRFIERFYTDPDRSDEPQEGRVSRLMERHARPYVQFKQVRPGYDMPTTPSWAIIEGEYHQSDWLFYKAAWLSGAPIVAAPPQGHSPARAPPGPVGVTPAAARFAEAAGGQVEEYTDVLGRSARWTPGWEQRALRPSLLMPDFWTDLSNRYPSIEQFNLAIGLARTQWQAAGQDAGSVEEGSSKSIQPTGRDLLLARTLDLSSLGGPSGVPEPSWIAAIRAALVARSPAAEVKGPPPGNSTSEAGPDRPAECRYLMPPRIDPDWAKLTCVLGLGSDRIARLNDRIETAWLARMQRRDYRAAHLEPFQSFEEVYLSSRRPIYEPLAEEWDIFVAAKVPPVMVQPIARDPTSQPDATAAVSAVQPPVPAAGAGDGKVKLAFDPAKEHLRLTEHAWRDFLFYLYSNGRGREGDFRGFYLPGQSDEQIAARVRRGQMLYGAEFDQFNLAAMPIVDRDVVEFADQKGELRRHFMLGNFTVVLDELVLEGRAMFNTIVLIFLAIATHVTVNPLAAYALSRFRLTYTYKVLLFMLATMAFPPAVGMIPGFLLLKHFGLINTYAALVLPGIASGYTIFLLKGFFDALPQELYEAAEIDGAGKVTTFLNVTFPLSKPIFAIITLNSFTAAYSGFMWAFLICPDSKMWTVMVHLFNIQQNSTPPIAMAALVIAAVPTFLVFLFCQNVILRGIIIPSFK